MSFGHVMPCLDVTNCSADAHFAQHIMCRLQTQFAHYVLHIGLVQVNPQNLRQRMLFDVACFFWAGCADGETAISCSSDEDASWPAVCTTHAEQADARDLDDSLAVEALTVARFLADHTFQPAVVRCLSGLEAEPHMTALNNLLPPAPDC